MGFKVEMSQIEQAPRKQTEPALFSSGEQICDQNDNIFAILEERGGYNSVPSKPIHEKAIETCLYSRRTMKGGLRQRI